MKIQLTHTIKNVMAFSSLKMLHDTIRFHERATISLKHGSIVLLLYNEHFTVLRTVILEVVLRFTVGRVIESKKRILRFR